MEIRILGRIALLHRGTEIDLGPRKQRLLLAALIVAPGRSRSTDGLVEDLWPADAPRNPKASLYAYISRLRKVFAACVGRTVIENTVDGYRLMLDTGELDAERFEEDLRAAADEHNEHRAVARLDRAFARWTGDPFMDLADEHLVGEMVSMLWAHRREAEQTYVQLLTRTDQAGRAVAVAREIVARDPLDEATHWLVMFALDRAGRRAEALRHYVSARKLLLDEVGLEPGPELQRLERAILDSEVKPSFDDPGDEGRTPPSRPRSSFVGRDDELATLVTVACSPDRATNVAIVQGEAGIGKSRLLQAIAESAAARAHWLLRIEIERSGTRASLLPIASALVRLADAAPRGTEAATGSDHRDVLQLVEDGALDAERGRPDDGEDVFRYRVTEALDHYLNRLANAAPVLVLVDDAQWSSPALLDVLLGLATRPRPNSVSFVIAARRDRTPDVSSVLSRLRRATEPEVIELDGLDAPAVAQLARARLGDRGVSVAAEIQEWTQGNPFFVHELLRVLDDRVFDEITLGASELGDGEVGQDATSGSRLAELALPASVSEAVHSHVAELSYDAIEVLNVAALVDGWFDPLLCAGVVDHPGQISDLIDQLLATELVVEHPSEPLVGFKHDLVRMSIRRRLSSTRQAELHGRIGLALAATLTEHHAGSGGADHGRRAELLASVAHHLCSGAAAGTAVEGATYSLRAIHEARHRADGSEARRLAADALRALDRPHAARDTSAEEVAALRAELLYEEADAHKWLLDHVEAHNSLRLAFQIARDHNLIDLAVRALRGFSGQTAQGWLGSWSYPDESIAMAEGLIERAGGLDAMSPETTIGVLGPYGEAVLDLGDGDRADELTSAAVSAARRVEDRSLRAFAAERRLAFVDTTPDTSERVELCRLMLDADPGHPRYTPLAYRHLLIAALEAGDREEAESCLLAIDELAAHSRSELVGIEAAVSRTAFDLLMGNLPDALERYERTCNRFSHLDVGRLDVLHVQLFWLQWLAGDIPDAERAIRDRLADNETPSWKSSLLLILITDGRLDEASELADSMTMAEYTHIRESALQYYTPAVLAETVAVLGDTEKARWLLPVLEPVADRVVSLYGGTLLVGWAALPVGRLQGVVGNYCEAEANIELAASRAQRVGSPLLRLQAEVARAELDVRRGSPNDPHLGRLRERARRDGFGNIAQWCDRLIGERWTADHAGGPTPTDRKRLVLPIPAPPAGESNDADDDPSGLDDDAGEIEGVEQADQYE